MAKQTNQDPDDKLFREFQVSQEVDNWFDEFWRIYMEDAGGAPSGNIPVSVALSAFSETPPHGPMKTASDPTMEPWVMALGFPVPRDLGSWSPEDSYLRGCYVGASTFKFVMERFIERKRTSLIGAGGGGAGLGALKGPLALFVLALNSRGVALEAEVIQAFFGKVEDALTPGRVPTRDQEAALGLFLEANRKTPKPLAADHTTPMLDETGRAPVIQYRLEGDLKLRTCKDRTLRTRVIPAVRRVLSHK